MTAILVWRIQRQNLLEAVRPKLILDGWTRTVQTRNGRTYDTLSFAMIQNVGAGIAMPWVRANARSEWIIEGRPVVSMGTIHIGPLAPGRTANVDGSISLWWESAGGRDAIIVDIEILTWDVRNRRHETTYTMVVVDLSSRGHGVAHEVARGVGFDFYRTRIRPRWMLKVHRALVRQRSILPAALLQKLPASFTHPMSLPKRLRGRR